MRRGGVALSGLLIAASVFLWSGPAAAETAYLFGKIGDFPVAALLDREEGMVSGWYFYQSRAKLIRLEGKIDRGGTFRMDEVTDGKKTGIFEGTVREGRWAGMWRKAPGAPPLAFSLEENRDKLTGLKGEYRCEVSERVARYGYTYRWNLRLGLADGKVKRIESAQGSHGDNKDEQTCSIDLTDLIQTATSEAGILLSHKDNSPGEEGGKCTVRIVGSGDLLWVRFGDSSEEGNDCRSAGPNMLCSPRAFWNDIILDRRTQKCKALK